MSSWLLYGAYGYTGILLAEEAVRRGHMPVLAGRSAKKLVPLANRLGLEYVVLNLQDESTLHKTVADFDLVFHAAGPFVHTHRPMLKACLAGQTHYLDVTGELTVFEENLSYDEQARQQGIAVISGAGFDVVPTNCLATHVANQISNPTRLEIAIAALGGISRGTTKTMLEHLSGGIQIRRTGRLEPFPIGHGLRRLPFADKERTVLPLTWGDLTTAYQSTGIKNITTYLAYPANIASMMRWAAPPMQKLFSASITRRAAQKVVEKVLYGPNETIRNTARCQIWAYAANQSGDETQAWLETSEAYHYTAVASVRCVEKTLDINPQGVLAPAQAFGPEFAFDIPGTTYFDRLS